MTKGEMIELVYLYLAGGQINADLNIKREDISAMLAPAVNLVVLQESRMRRQESMQGATWESTSTGVDADFIGTFYLDVLFDTQRNLYYINPKIRVVPLPFNRGIDTIAAMQGDLPFVKMKGQFEDANLNGILRNQVRYWFERIDTEQRIFFKNIPTSIDKVILKAVVSANDLKDDDEVPLPSGKEYEVLQLLQQWFSGEKQFPEDLRNNNSDGSSQINIQKNPIR
jgi:hypothetical protein